MHLKRIFLLTLVSAFSMVQGQEDSLIIKLDTIAIKANEQQESIYKNQKVDNLTQQYNQGKDLARQLENLTGVQVRKSGSNMSKPIVDGLSSSRLVYMVNGVKLENQDWADSHPPEIDADFAENLQVIRGSETVKYGSNALGGVVQIDAGKIPRNKQINGTAGIHYSSNTKGWGGHLKIQQNSALINGLRWRLTANNIQNGDYSTADYNVGNSGTRLESYSAALNYKIKDIAIKGFYSYYKGKQGNYFGALTGNIEEFEQRIALGKPLQILPYSFAIEHPYEESKHQIASLSAQWKIGRHWEILGQYAYQENHREEYDVRRSTVNTVPVQNMRLTSNHWKAELQYKNNSLESIFGFQFRNKENYNVPGTGVVPALPNYIFKEHSIYSYHTLQKLHWAWNAGLRYDWAISNARGINFISELYGEDKDFSSFSAQLATVYNNNKWQFNSSLSYGWRIPETHELYANGKQHGIPIYFVGDSDLKEEKGLKWMNTIQYKSKNFETELQGFVHLLDDYIYAIPSHEFKQLFSGPAALFQFKQQDAIIYGIDLLHTTHITNQISLSHQLSWIKGKENKTKLPLPNISPLRLHNAVRFNLPKMAKTNHNVFEITHDWVAKKNNYNAAYELSSHVPDAYHLFHLALSSTYSLDQTSNVRFTLSVDNLFNHLYKDYLNLHRYFVHESGRSINLNIQLQF